MKSTLIERIDATLSRLTGLLLGELKAEGFWEGELSSSALSTAVAAIALQEMDRRRGCEANAALITGGLRWLAENANSDGGWGDTIKSKSNISTTALCWAAFGACCADAKFERTVAAAAEWLGKSAGSLENLPQAIRERYGKDKTFSIPILLTLAISGRLGPGAWHKIPCLPFELAMLPRRWYGAARLPVVSYALPALIAIGQALHYHAPSRNPITRRLRNASRSRTLNLLRELQPANGGFLEATPLTAFVTMSLVSCANHNHPVALKAAEFLRLSVRSDGSWPIDTNLATWVTTLSINALTAQPGILRRDQEESLRSWLLKQQTKGIHPYTGAAPGAWAWTDLPGGVPDADDTAGALTALYELGQPDARTIQAAEGGVKWLLDLANRDGGIPTFCPGWGTLPFDRSTPEITAHALRAWVSWQESVNSPLQRRIRRAIARGMSYLKKNQAADGSFVPLWFGNESTEDESNCVYGTAQVLIALDELMENGVSAPEQILSRASAFLAQAQKRTGGWGGGGDACAPESIEETAVSLEALAANPAYRSQVERGAEWLVNQLEGDGWKRAAPIGLYFARLWYYESLYPLIFSVSALAKVRSKLS